MVPDATFEEQMAALEAAVAEGKARRRHPTARNVKRSPVAPIVRIREMTEAEYRDEEATTAYEESGGAWTARFAAQPAEGLRFYRRPGR